MNKKESKTTIEILFSQKETDKLKRSIATSSNLSEVQLELPEVHLSDFAKAMETEEPIFCLKLQSLKEKGINMDSIPGFSQNDFVYVALQPVNVNAMVRKDNLIVVNGTIEVPLKGKTVVEIDQAVLTDETIARTLAALITESLRERVYDLQSLTTKVGEFYDDQIDNDRW